MLLFFCDVKLIMLVRLSIQRQCIKIALGNEHMKKKKNIKQIHQIFLQHLNRIAFTTSQLTMKTWHRYNRFKPRSFLLLTILEGTPVGTQRLNNVDSTLIQRQYVSTLYACLVVPLVFVLSWPFHCSLRGFFVFVYCASFMF